MKKIFISCLKIHIFIGGFLDLNTFFKVHKPVVERSLLDEVVEAIVVVVTGESITFASLSSTKSLSLSKLSNETLVSMTGG